AMLDWIGFWFVAEMPFAREVSGVAVLLEELRNGRRLLAQRVLVARRDDVGQGRANRNAPGNERGAPGRATGLAVPAREHRALLGEPINIRGRMAEGHAASRITAEIVPAGVVLHQHDDVWFLGVCCLRRSADADDQPEG